MANFNLNKVTLGGRLCEDPELKSTQSGLSVLSFRLAVNRRTAPKNADGTVGKPLTDFISCVAWRERAEFIAKYFRKGSSIAVSGAIQTRSFTDQQGNKRYAVEVIADEIYFVDSKAENEARSARAPMPGDADAPVVGEYIPSEVSGAPGFELVEDEEELPF